MAGIGIRRLNQLISDSRLPIEVKKGAPEGYWNTTRAITEILGYYRRQADKSRPSFDTELDREQRKEELRKIRIANAKSQRELLPISVIAQAWGEMLAVFKNRFHGYADKMGPIAYRAKDKVEAGELLATEIRDIFSGLPAEVESLVDRISLDEFSEDGDPATTSGPKDPTDLVKKKP